MSWNAEPKVDSLPRNTYAPGSHLKDFWMVTTNDIKKGGGKKKIESKKLQWSSKARVGSLSNINYQPKCAQKKVSSKSI